MYTSANFTAEANQISLVKAVTDSTRAAIHTIPGIASTGISHSSITGIGSGDQIVVNLIEYNPDIIKLLPETIGGIEVVWHVTGKAYAWGCCSRVPSGCNCSPKGCNYPPSQGFGDKIRPIRPGLSIGSERIFDKQQCDSGTLGGFPIDSNGNKVILSNNHVMGFQYPGTYIGQIGDEIYQPGTLDNANISTDKIGNLAKVIRINQSGNKVDAAYATIDSGIQVDENASCGYKIGATIPVIRGMKIRKAGRTLGCSSTTITQVDVNNHSVDYGTGIGYFDGQILTGPNFSKPGDSGSVVVTDDENHNAVGLNFAGNDADASGIMNSMIEVESSLGISFGQSPTQPTGTHPTGTQPTGTQPTGTQPTTTQPVVCKVSDIKLLGKCINKKYIYGGFGAGLLGIIGYVVYKETKDN